MNHDAIVTREERAPAARSSLRLGALTLAICAVAAIAAPAAEAALTPSLTGD